MRSPPFFPCPHERPTRDPGPSNSLKAVSVGLLFAFNRPISVSTRCVCRRPYCGVQATRAGGLGRVGRLRTAAGWPGTPGAANACGRATARFFVCVANAARCTHCLAFSAELQRVGQRDHVLTMRFDAVRMEAQGRCAGGDQDGRAVPWRAVRGRGQLELPDASRAAHSAGATRIHACAHRRRASTHVAPRRAVCRLAKPASTRVLQGAHSSGVLEWCLLHRRRSHCHRGGSCRTGSSVSSSTSIYAAARYDSSLCRT